MDELLLYNISIKFYLIPLFKKIHNFLVKLYMISLIFLKIYIKKIMSFSLKYSKNLTTLCWRISFYNQTIFSRDSLVELGTNNLSEILYKIDRKITWDSRKRISCFSQGVRIGEVYLGQLFQLQVRFLQSNWQLVLFRFKDVLGC